MDEELFFEEESESFYSNLACMQSSALMSSHFSQDCVTERSHFGPLSVSGKLPTYPSQQANINTYFSLTAKCWLKGRVGGQFFLVVRDGKGPRWDVSEQAEREGTDP